MIALARNFNLKIKEQKDLLKITTLDRWDQDLKKHHQDEAIEDKSNHVCAFDSIANRHPEFKGKEELVGKHSNDLKRVFNEAET